MRTCPWRPHGGHTGTGGRTGWLRTFVTAQLAQCVELLGVGMVLLLSRQTEAGSSSVSSASSSSSGTSRDPSPQGSRVRRDNGEASHLGHSGQVTLSHHLSPAVIRMELASGVFDARHADNTEVLLALLTQNKELEGRFKKKRKAQLTLFKS